MLNKEKNVEPTFKSGNDAKPIVSGALPLYDVEELNEIVTKFNNKEMILFDFVGRVWNKAYMLGCVDGSKSNDR